MKTAIFVLLDKYADWEGAYLASQLNQSKRWNIKTASNQTLITSIGGFSTQVDLRIEDIPESADLLVLIGGDSWNTDIPALTDILKNRIQNKKPVGSICGSVDYLAAHGLLNSRKHTGNSKLLWRNFAEYKNGNHFMLEQSVSDNNLVTANGTAALEFTINVLKMVEFKEDQQVERDINLFKLGYYKYVEKYGNPYE
ncbi:type 1 glutamine amidotransferase family protein [Lacticaseibacillus paracasei]|uniref:type 1 glutamine amidotransferase family protein n=1 Tax=Lacticaseibacillus paracasei TaxID=1597 RepID=UPI003B513436